MEDLNLQTASYLATGFRDVDAAVAQKMAQCLEFLDSLPSVQRYKNSIIEALHPQPGDIIADFGCGLGFDVDRLAGIVAPRGLAIGVDSSQKLLEAARSISRNAAVEFVIADVQKLPFENGCLNSCKVDRTLQHVENPALAASEMFRTVRPGGVVVCAEPDWGTFTIDHDDRPMVRKITEFWEGSFRNPWVGRQLPNQLRDAGFSDVQVHGLLLTVPSFESSDKVFDIVQTAIRLAEVTGNSKPIEWISNARERDRMRPVSSSVTIFVNFARKPKAA